MQTGAVYDRCAWALSAVWDAAKDTRDWGWREFAGALGWLAGQWQRGAVRPGWNRSQPGEGAAELLRPRPAIRKMQGQQACRAGEPSGQGV